MTLARAALVLGLGGLAACATSREKSGLAPRPEVSPTFAASASGRRLAVLIGIDENRDEAWPRLRYAGSDARDLARVLAEGGHFETELLTGAQATTREHVLAALERLAAKNRSPEDVVVVYFSGHGTLARRPQGALSRFLVTSDARRSTVADTALAVDALDERFAALTSRRKVMILAACHSGSGKSMLPEEVERELRGIKGDAPPPLADVSRGVTTLSASAWGEPAREDDLLGHDIYTHFLLEALVQRQDRNHDGAVSAEEAHDWARARTYYFTQGRQTPTAESAVVGVDPVVLVGDPNGPGLPEIGSYEESWLGAEVKVDGTSVGTLPGSIPVAAGRHHVQVLKGEQALADSTVQLEPGERLDLGALTRPGEARLSLEARGGFQVLLTPQLRAQIGGPMPLGQVAVWLPRLILRRLDVGIDLAFGRIATDIAPDGIPVPVTLTLTEAGLGVQLPLTFGRFSLGIGPRLSFAWFARNYSAGRSVTDSAFLTVPGVSVDARLYLGAGFSALLGARVSYSAMMLDGATTHLGAASLWGGIGYRLQ